MSLEDHEHINDLWEDMDRLNMLYEELCWDHMDVLEMVPDYKNDRIIIKNKSRQMDKMHKEMNNES
mgnify:FL=1|tara:strand:- start:211 stop:408 length:198 start_codon:yes stop_codon:yes gene_type:complete